jgi:hypothetical protein
MTGLNIIRYASLAALLGLCCLSAPLQAGGLKGGNDIANIKKIEKGKQPVSNKGQETRDLKQANREGNSVPEPVSLLAALAAGGTLFGLGLYHRRRS